MGKIVIVVDTREQRPIVFPEHTTVRGTLPTGDYSVLGYQHLIAVERKSHSDLIASYTKDRERFFNEIARLSLIPYSMILAEIDYSKSMYLKCFFGGGPRVVKKQHVAGTTSAIVAKYGVPVMFCGTRKLAGEFVISFLEKSYEDCNTRSGFLRAGMDRVTRLSTCCKCGISQHEFVLAGGNLEAWKSAVSDAGAGDAVCWCGTCSAKLRCPKGFRWAPNGTILARGQKRGR